MDIKVTKENMLQGLESVRTYDFLIKLKGIIKANSFNEFVTNQEREERGNIHKLLRYIITGKHQAPSNDQLISILGVDEVIARINNYMKVIDDKYDFKQFYA